LSTSNGKNGGAIAPDMDKLAQPLLNNGAKGLR